MAASRTACVKLLSYECSVFLLNVPLKNKQKLIKFEVVTVVPWSRRWTSHIVNDNLKSDDQASACSDPLQRYSINQPYFICQKEKLVQIW